MKIKIFHFEWWPYHFFFHSRIAKNRAWIVREYNFKETIKTCCGTISESAQPTLQCRTINNTHRRRLFNAELIAFRRFWMDESMNICIQPHSMLYVLAWSRYMLNHTHTHTERYIYTYVLTYAYSNKQNEKSDKEKERMNIDKMYLPLSKMHWLAHHRLPKQQSLTLINFFCYGCRYFFHFYRSLSHSLSA